MQRNTAATVPARCSTDADEGRVTLRQPVGLRLGLGVALLYTRDAATAVSTFLSQTVDTFHTWCIYRCAVSINLNHLHYHINVGRISASVT